MSDAALVALARPDLRAAVRRDRLVLACCVAMVGLLLLLEIQIWVSRGLANETGYIEEGQIVSAQVVSVGHPPLSKNTVVKVADPDGGDPVKVNGAERLVPLPVPGQSIRVVYNIKGTFAVDVEWKGHWLLSLIGMVLCTALGIPWVLKVYRQVRLPWRVRRTLSRSRAADALVTVVEMYRVPRTEQVLIREAGGEPERFTPVKDILLVVQDTEGRRWTWTLRWFQPYLVKVGNQLPVIGSPGPGAWLVGIARPPHLVAAGRPPELLLPSRPLQEQKPL